MHTGFCERVWYFKTGVVDDFMNIVWFLSGITGLAGVGIFFFFFFFFFALTRSHMDCM